MNQPKAILPARRNPFAAHRVEQIPYRFADGDWSTHLSRLAQLGFRAAIVGPHGTGKTTLLEQLVAKLHACAEAPSDVRHVFLSRDPATVRRQLELVGQPCSGNACWLVDGFERLDDHQRKELLAAASGGLVVTAHRNCSLPVWISTTSSLATLNYLLDQLGLQKSSNLNTIAAEAFHKSRGNLRDTLRILYDLAGEVIDQRREDRSPVA